MVFVAVQQTLSFKASHSLLSLQKICLQNVSAAIYGSRRSPTAPGKRLHSFTPANLILEQTCN